MVATTTAAVLLTAPLGWTTATADPAPTPTPSATASGLPVEVTLTGLTPLAPQPGDVLDLRGTLTNLSPTPVTAVSVRLLLSRSKVGSRGAFDDYADTPDGAPPTDAVALDSATTALPQTDLPAGESESFSVSVPINDLQLPEVWQVYELAVDVAGDTVTGHVTVGRLRTFLPWAPLGVPGVGLPTRVAWVWPLADRPHRTSGAVWSDDLLATEFASAGRLGRLLAAGERAATQQPPPAPEPAKTNKKKRRHAKATPPPQPRPEIKPVPVTWAIDPLLVQDAATMAAGYEVHSGDGAQAGRGRTTAQNWLSTLRRATATAGVFALPYADPDVTAAARAGLGTEMQVAMTAGDELLADPRMLDHQPLPYAWPPDGLADLRTLNTLFAAGETTVVLDSSSLPVIGGATFETPSAHTQVQSRDGTFDALLADHKLNQIVDDGAQTAAAGALAIQRFLSELLMVQAELPADQRSLVITPNRRWAPSAAYAQAILGDTGQVPWVEPVSLAQVASGPLYEKVERSSTLAYPDEERARQLHRTYLDRVRAIKRRVDAFALILPAGNAQAHDFDNGVLRLLSSAWRADPGIAREYRVRFAKELTDTMNKVHIVGRSANEGPGLVTLTSHSGTVPVTVSNELDSPVKVEISIEAGGHLVVKGGRTVTIQAHRQIPVDVRATAQTSGVFPLTVSLYTPGPEHLRYGQRVELRVRSTAYGSTALLITGGATAVLLLTVIVRLVRRARVARKSAPGTA